MIWVFGGAATTIGSMKKMVWMEDQSW